MSMLTLRRKCTRTIMSTLIPTLTLTKLMHAHSHAHGHAHEHGHGTLS